MSESIDIYDANLDHLGTMDRIEAHRSGQWHRTFHCWVVSGEGALLFQKRSDTMRNFPGLLDVSAAGHLDAGESVEDGLREVKEELGIDVSIEDLTYLGDRVEVADQANGQRNREYQAVYLGVTDLPLGSFEPEKEEIAALVWLPLREGMQLFTGETDSLDLEGYSFEYSEDGAWEPFTLPVTRESFLPRIQRYYLTSLIMAERAVSGAGPLAIS